MLVFGPEFDILSKQLLMTLHIISCNQQNTQMQLEGRRLIASSLLAFGYFAGYNFFPLL